MKQHQRPSRTARILLACVLGFLLAWQVAPAPAQYGQPAASPTPAFPLRSSTTLSPLLAPRSPAAGFTKIPSDRTGNEETMRLPLRRLVALTDPILLRNASSIYTVFVPQSGRVRLKSCSLFLDFTNSIALLGERSVIRVVMNDVIIAQYYLDRNHPFNSVEVPLPLNVLKTGFNRLQFIVAQHYTTKCEDPTAPELYTEINPDTSFLSAVAEWKEVPQRLSFLRYWIDEKLWNPYQFNVCIPGATTEMSDSQLAWGARITQGVALALNYQPFRVSTAAALRPGMDNIVVGTASDLSGFLTATEVGWINGSFLAVKALPGDPTHCMIIISGRQEQEVDQAALTFGLVNFPLPDSQYTIVDQTALPSEPAYVRNAPLQTPGVYGFKQLGYVTTSLRGWHTGNYQLQLYMPGDISKDDGSNAELRLHFVYGGAFRKDSVLNIFVNGIFQKDIRLDDPEGSMHSDHRLYLPMIAFQPGRNTVDITPSMVPLYSQQCEILQEENLIFTLYDDSEFVFPHALHKARLPSLGLFSQTAYPYSAPPDGSDTAVYVGGHDENTICAAWTLLGKMAQVSGALLRSSEMSFKVPHSGKSLLVVGPRDQIPDEIVSKAPVSPLQVGKMRYLVSVSPKPERLAASPIEEFMEKIKGTPADRSEPEPPATANLSLSAADMVQDTVAIQFESPFAVGYPVTLVTANDPTLLLKGINALQDRSVWDSLAGDLAVWNENPDSLAVCQIGHDFIYRSTSVITRVSVGLDRYPLLFAVIIVAFVLIAALALTTFLKRRETTTEFDERE